MNEHSTSDASTDVVRLDEGHHEGTGGLPERFENPGLPPHVHRLSDDSEGGAKRAERQVATMFGLSMLATLLFIVAYFAIDRTASIYLPGIGKANALNVSLGVTMGLSLFLIGAGAVHWAKTLMPDTEIVEERHVQRSDDATRDKAVGIVLEGGEKAQLGRRPLIKASMSGALGLFALPFVVQVAGSLGNPTTALSGLRSTLWDAATAQKPMRLVRDPEGTPVKAEDVTIGSVFHILPENIKDSEHVLEDKGKAAVLLMRLDPSQFMPGHAGDKSQSWGYQGIIAYSKICTHVGCPVGLYEQQTHHLLCPCHQSTFDATNDMNVIFGPAKRPLPQLKITVDDEGYLVAPQGFQEPVGPSFWER
ncbi:ubiquinol-cytochrome c reductase iron-sulfur subunit [Lapillicoccus jejuensis]|uniref:Cytochrome bc1 complex Rieske iron-sulfur subunit n=1 Tax=Lapillicoccus jejuensis TaxID=402171 RepID=A0A542E5U0_9MICO|nr:Rieske 2Fe-2S domain-containing protein [Lapillicoccus jejuensis]TQJ10654.1 menaquinol-cytochrome c reductase iron-sulfur subunit precursor [Lapillicoccus jejuensis]